jgi:hypothetical protein
MADERGASNPGRKRPFGFDDILGFAAAQSECARTLRIVGTHYDQLGDADRARVDWRLARIFEAAERAARAFKEIVEP